MPGIENEDNLLGASTVESILSPLGQAIINKQRGVNLISIDPGTRESAYCYVQGGVPVAFGKVDNGQLLSMLRTTLGPVTICVCERIRGYGMAVGQEVFETCEWSGRFQEAWLARSRDNTWHWLERRAVKIHLCGSMKAKDANVRQSILDRFGGKDKAIGSIKSKGVLYGVKADMWSAVGIALTFMDTADLPTFGGILRGATSLPSSVPASSALTSAAAAWIDPSSELPPTASA